jgi:hypothetical protein
MQKITAKVDRQATSLLDLTLWSNVIVVLIIIGINIVNIIRSNSEQGALVNAASPGLVAIVSLALILYLCYGCLGAFMTRRRLGGVFVTLDDAGVSGVSMPNPMSSEPGETFSVVFTQIQSVSIDGVAITKKHTALSLKLESDGRTYIVPAPEGLKEIVSRIAEQMTAK